MALTNAASISHLFGVDSRQPGRYHMPCFALPPSRAFLVVIMLVYCYVLHFELLMPCATRYLDDTRRKVIPFVVLLLPTNIFPMEHPDTKAALGRSFQRTPLQRSCISYQSVCSCRSFTRKPFPMEYSSSIQACVSPEAIPNLLGTLPTYTSSLPYN